MVARSELQPARRKRRRVRIVRAAGIALLMFAGALAVLDQWGWRLQDAYAVLIGYDGCRCEQCRDYYLGAFWYEKFGCNGPRHDRLWSAAWLAGFAAALLTGPLVPPLIRRFNLRGRIPGHCPTCGYDMRGLPTLKCPECGRSPS